MSRAAFLALALSLPAAALAQGGGPAKPGDAPGGPAKGGPTAEAKPAPQRSLDELFARLAAANDEAEANGIANLIERRWSRSGSDTAPSSR